MLLYPLDPQERTSLIYQPSNPPPHQSNSNQTLTQTLSIAGGLQGPARLRDGLPGAHRPPQADGRARGGGGDPHGLTKGLEWDAGLRLGFDLARFLSLVEGCGLGWEQGFVD